MSSRTPRFLSSGDHFHFTLRHRNLLQSFLNVLVLFSSVLTLISNLNILISSQPCNLYSSKVSAPTKFPKSSSIGPSKISMDRHGRVAHHTRITMQGNNETCKKSIISKTTTWSRRFLHQYLRISSDRGQMHQMHGRLHNSHRTTIEQSYLQV